MPCSRSPGWQLCEGGGNATPLDQIFATGPSFSLISKLLPPIFMQAHVFSVLSLVNAQMNQGLSNCFRSVAAAHIQTFERFSGSIIKYDSCQTFRNLQ